MKMITVIETHYNNCRFRSRTEARWAAYFDYLGIKYEYEPEGFEIDRTRYLPDFLLFGVSGAGNVFAEVKPHGGDFTKAKMLSKESMTPILLLEGPPSPTSAIKIHGYSNNFVCPYIERIDVDGPCYSKGEKDWTYRIRWWISGDNCDLTCDHEKAALYVKGLRFENTDAYRKHPLVREYGRIVKADKAPMRWPHKNWNDLAQWKIVFKDTRTPSA